jgi:hypothetical protein
VLLPMLAPAVPAEGHALMLIKLLLPPAAGPTTVWVWAKPLREDGVEFLPVPLLSAGLDIWEPAQVLHRQLSEFCFDCFGCGLEVRCEQLQASNSDPNYVGALRNP